MWDTGICEWGGSGECVGICEQLMNFRVAYVMGELLTSWASIKSLRPTASVKQVASFFYFFFLFIAGTV
jgi:hypothetical protein